MYWYSSLATNSSSSMDRPDPLLCPLLPFIIGDVLENHVKIVYFVSFADEICFSLFLKRKRASVICVYPAILDPLVITVVIFAEMTACRKDTFFMYS